MNVNNSISEKYISLLFNCRQNWNGLDVTSSPLMRYCTTCKKNVFLVSSDTDFLEAVDSNKCMAISNNHGLISHVGFIPKEKS